MSTEASHPSCDSREDTSPSKHSTSVTSTALIGLAVTHPWPFNYTSLQPLILVPSITGVLFHSMRSSKRSSTFPLYLSVMNIPHSCSLCCYLCIRETHLSRLDTDRETWPHPIIRPLASAHSFSYFHISTVHFKQHAIHQRLFYLWSLSAKTVTKRKQLKYRISWHVLI